MKVLLSILSCFLLLTTLSCKKTPDFVTSNDLDPVSKDYEVPNLQKVSLSVINEDREPLIRIRWEVSDGYNDGIYIKKYNPNTDIFEFLAKVSRHERDYIDENSRQTLTPRYVAYTYVERLTDVVGLSEDSIEVEASFALKNFSAEILDKNRTKLTWNHDYIADNAKVIIERQTNTDEVYSERASLNLSENSFIDDISTLTESEFSYRIYTKSNLERSDTLFTSNLILAPRSPDNLDILSIAENEITLGTYFPYVFDSFDLSIEDASGKTLPISPRTTVKGDSIYFEIQDLSFASSSYDITLLSILNGVRSEPLVKKIIQVPSMELSTRFRTNGEIYVPSFNSSTNELIYLKEGEVLQFAKYSFDTNQSSIIPSYTTDYSNTYYDKESNTIYGIVDSHLIRWNLKGEKLESHPLPDERFSQVVVSSTYNIAFFKIYQQNLFVYDLDADEEVHRFGSVNSELNISENGEFLTVTSISGSFELIRINPTLPTLVSHVRNTYTPFNIYDLKIVGSSIYIWNNYESGLLEYTTASSELISDISINIEELSNFEIIDEEHFFVANGGSYYSPDLFFIELNSGSLLNKYNFFEEDEIYIDQDAELIYDLVRKKLIIIDRFYIYSFNIITTWKFANE